MAGSAIKASALILIAGLVAGCQTTGSGSPQVTCETIRFVYLSHKDTAGTIRQVVANNGAWVALCGKPPAYKK